MEMLQFFCTFHALITKNHPSQATISLRMPANTYKFKNYMHEVVVGSARKVENVRESEWMMDQLISDIDIDSVRVSSGWMARSFSEVLKCENVQCQSYSQVFSFLKWIMHGGGTFFVFQELR